MPQVIASYLPQIQGGLLKEGFNVTSLSAVGPLVLPNETPADQIAIQLSQAAWWIRYRSDLIQAFPTASSACTLRKYRALLLTVQEVGSLPPAV